MPVQVHNTYDENRVTTDLVNDAVREAIGPAAACAFGEFRPGTRKLDDPCQCSFDLGGKFVTETLALLVVVGDGIYQLRFGGTEKADIHERLGLFIF
jgi:hypothetical protein